MPAAQSIHQRYEAGDCTLDLTLQPSSLSQWYPQPIVDRVQFQLWMRDAQSPDETEAPVLLAEGDRTDLQMIVRYVEHRTRKALAWPHSRREDTQSLPPLPLGCHLPEPMSYLHLCDLSSVLNQYEQATAPLPVELDIAPERSQSAAGAIPKPLGQTTRSSAGRSQKLRRRGWPLPFRSGRTVWASSAAAALLAVGLTTLVWNRSSVQTASSVADAELAEPGLTGSEPDGLNLNKGEKPERSARLPEDSTSPAAEAARPSGSSIRLRNRRNTAANNRPASAPSVEATAPPVTAEKQGVDESAPVQANADSEQFEDRSEAENSSADTNAVAVSPTQTDDLPPARSADGLLDRAVAQADSDRRRSNAPDLPVLPPAEPLPTASDQPGAIASARRAPLAESEASSESFVSVPAQESETIAQVQSYFSSQWRPDASLSSPFTYQLQLSEFGEVVGFSALTEAGGAYRDRLLPDSSISFPPSNSAALANGLTLTVTVSPDGQVQVQKP